MLEQRAEMGGGLSDGRLPLLKASCLRIWEDERGRLWMKMKKDGERRQARLRAAFPLTRPGRFVIVEDASGEGVGIIADVAELRPKARRCVEAILERQHFMPRIQRIEDIQMHYGLLRWRTQTDRGPREFDTTARSPYDIRRIDHARMLVRDVDGNRYEIPDIHKLDSRSRVLLEFELGG